MGTIEKSRELTEALKATPEFRELKQAKLEMEKNRGLVKEVEDFNKRQEELYNAKLSIKEAEQKSVELNKKYKSLSQLPEVARYMSAAKKFNDVMLGVMKFLNDSLETELKLK